MGPGQRPLPPDADERPVSAEDETVIVSDGPPEEPRRRFPPDLDRDVGIAVVALLLMLLIAAGVYWFAVREDEQTVPDVVGLQVTEAEARLAEEDFESDVERTFTADAAVDEVVDQSPAAGEEAPEDGRVTLTVSDGPQQVVLVRVVGMTVEDATEMLEAEGIQVETRDVASDAERGTVVRQTPAAGQEVDRTAVTVVLDVAARPAPETVEVPGLVGMSSRDARDALEDLGLRHTQRPESSQEPQGNVIAQDPGAGTEVELDTVVTLTISTGPPG